MRVCVCVHGRGGGGTSSNYCGTFISLSLGPATVGLCSGEDRTKNAASDDTRAMFISETRAVRVAVSFGHSVRDTGTTDLISLSFVLWMNEWHPITALE